METVTGRAQIFDLPESLAAKADPALIGGDQEHLAAVGRALEETIDDLAARLDETRLRRAGGGQQALERDQEVHRLTARLRTLRRFGLDLCLGRMVLSEDAPSTDGEGVGPPDAERVGLVHDEGARSTDDGGAPSTDGGRTVYVGRLGLTDRTGRRLLVDWRSPAAEPFFGATHANPMGLVSRRRYRWSGGRVTDYWDEVFTPAGLEGHAALDDQSAFIASLGTNRSRRMRDVLGTIQSDQDAIIRAGSRGALVVDGGPGTGKTVVALHRSAYLLYADPRLGHHRGGVLVVGPHQPYLAYVSDVLPSLGEEGVQTCTLRDLLPEGARALPEEDPEVAALKASADMVRAIETAVRFYEEPPDQGMTVSVDVADIRVTGRDWREAFDAAPPDVPHNEAREQVLDALLDILVDKVDAATDEDDDEEVQPELLRRSLRADAELISALNAAWPLLDPGDLVGDLWTVPAFLRLAAPWLSRDQVRLLQRPDAQAWTESDLPLLDAARQRLGDPDASRRQLRRKAALAAQHEQLDQVIDHLVDTDDSDLQVMSMLRGDDLRGALVDEDVLPEVGADLLAGPFAHVVVDEAQELTDAEWQMLLVRCPSRSFTVVGDRAQARHGFTESWQERLERVGLDRVTVSTLTINYRTPQEVMAEAEPVIREALPDANVPVSIRSTGIPVSYGRTADLRAVVDEWLRTHAEGIACVIGDPTFAATERVQSLTPQLAKGLEFDLVVLVEPEEFGTGIEGAVDHYVSMTRTTQQLVVLTDAGGAV